MSLLNESCNPDRKRRKSLSLFCADFGLTEEDLGTVLRIRRRCFLIDSSNHDLLELQETLKKRKIDLFGVGVYLGEEKKVFEPSPALIELLSARTKEHKAVVDEKAEWLFLCGRDIFAKGIAEKAVSTRNGLVFVMNSQGENLGYGKLVKEGNVAIKNILDRGFYLRRERMA